MSEPHGPIRISGNRQIALPKTLTDRVRLEPGDFVYVLQSDVEPSSLVVVPVEVVTEWIQAGRRQAGGAHAALSEEVEGDG
ncbi:MAG: AbrB/MazE/SpoVT family DNA-binding domain-containing protein [Actinobacteria bacterium]|nr:AbrB/MazE/SpoVT family DNA-binding domain-containing protein [Actinomycetota bacterium]